MIGRNLGGVTFCAPHNIQFGHLYNDIISVENLLEAWKEFASGKQKRRDVQDFKRHLLDNILELHHDLANKKYAHSTYWAFKISDPKPRDIHKASVRDRLLHHALYLQLYPFFERKFIADSYSCQKSKGVHRALRRFTRFAAKASKNHTQTAWVLKCDIRKFFASIDHSVLMDILRAYITDEDILWLLGRVVESFHSTAKGKGLPLGNLTSQLLVNIYMNKFDQFVKHKLRAKHYIRYADDFVLLSQNRELLLKQLPRIRSFLLNELDLALHPHKVSIATVASRIDFLGWVHFPKYCVLRTTTKRRMRKALSKGDCSPRTRESYKGLLSHGNTYKLQTEITR